MPGKPASPVRRGADGKGLGHQDLASGLPNPWRGFYQCRSYPLHPGGRPRVGWGDGPVARSILFVDRLDHRPLILDRNENVLELLRRHVLDVDREDERSP